MEMAMIKNNYRWVMVAAGGLLGCIVMGSMFSLPVFIRPIAADTGWSVTGVSSAMTVGFLSMAFAAMFWGSLSDRVGPFPVVLTGSILLPVSLLIVSQTTSLFAFQLLFGVLIGGSCAAILAPMMAAVTGWFETQRSLAVSLVSSGIGVAPLTMAPLAARLITVYDWRTSWQIIAAVAACVMIPVSLLVRRPPVKQAAPQAAGAPAAMSAQALGPQSDMTVAQALRSPQFIILLMTNFFCC